MKPEHIDAIHQLARTDPAVRAWLHTKYATGTTWEDMLVALVKHMAEDKAALTQELFKHKLAQPIIPISQAGQSRQEGRAYCSRSGDPSRPLCGECKPYGHCAGI
jgi:hypothetical protein